MDYKAIFDGRATLEDLYQLNKLGWEFIVADGGVKSILHG